MLKTVLETLDGIDDAVKPFYAETDAGYVLQVDGIDTHPEVANLRNAYSAEKQKRQKIAEERDAFKAKVSSLPEDFDPAQWAKIKEGKADPEELVQLRRQLEAEREEWRGKAEDANGKLRRFTVERTLTDALAAHGITDPTFQEAARALIAPQVQLSDDGKAIVETDMGPLPLPDHVQRWVSTKGKSFVTPPSGGGARGGNDGKTGNTVSRASFDKMSQAQRAEFSKSGGKVVED